MKGGSRVMSKIIIPTMKERFYSFMKDLEIVKTFNGVKALSRKNFSTASRVENGDGAIRIFLGSGFEMEIKESRSSFMKSYNNKFVCILKDIYHNRILYQGETMNEVMLWQAVGESKSIMPSVKTNLAHSMFSVEIPDITFNLQEVAENVLY